MRRIANLLQVSSAYGRAMESVDRTRMSAALTRAQVHAGLGTPHAATGRQRRRGLRGGLFVPDQPRPRSADRRLAKTQQALLHEALQEGWAPEAIAAALNEQHARRLT